MKTRVRNWAVITVGTLLAVTLLAGLVRFWQTDALKRITISRQTTYITTPSALGGGVDYLAWLNARLSAGVTPANNAAVLVYEACGAKMFTPGDLRGRSPPTGTNFILPGMAFSPQKLRRIVAKLGAKPGNPENPFVSYFQYASRRKWHNRHLPAAVLTEPWTADEFPHVAAWLKSQSAALSRVRRAANCARMYVPVIREGELPVSTALWVDFSQATEIVGNAMLSRALLRAGSGNIKGAWNDIEAVHKLSLLFDQGPFPNIRLIGIRTDSVAMQVIQSMARSERLSAAQALWCLHRMQRWQSPPSPAAVYDVGYRMMHLALLQKWARQGGFYPWAKNHFIDAFIPINYNAVMKRLNRICNDLTTASGLSDYRLAQDGQIAIGSKFRVTFHLSPWMSERHVTKMIVGTSMATAVGQELKFITMEKAEKTLTETSLALAAYHAAHHCYPQSLGDLVPAYLPALLRNPFDGKPLHFCANLKKSGYLLYYFSSLPGGHGKPYHDEEEIVSVHWSNPAPRPFMGLPYPPTSPAEAADFPGHGPVTCKCKNGPAKNGKGTGASTKPSRAATRPTK